MRLRSPAEYYLKFLLLSKPKPDAARALLEGEELGLDTIDVAYINGLQNKLKPPKPFYPFDAGHTRSRNYIIEQGVNRFFAPDRDTRASLALVRRPRVKEIIETMLLSGSPHEYICAVLRNTQRVTCTPGTLEQYAHYFWNMSLLDSSQMRMLLHLRYKDLNGVKPEGLSKELKGVYYQDPRRVAAEMPYSPTTAMLTQLRMGMQPGRAEIGKQLQEARQSAVLKGLESIHRDGPMDSQRAINYFNAARLMTDMLESVTRPEDDLQQQVNALQLRADTKPLVSLQQLSAGSHTADLQPLKDPRHDHNADQAFSGTGNAGD